MMTDEARRLPPSTTDAAKAEVEAAKARGWLQSDLRRWFSAQGVEYAAYKAALAGQAVELNTAELLTQVSITGLPARPQEPDPADIRKHLDWLIEPARGEYDDALIEIAYDDAEGSPRGARLFGFDEIDQAVAYAVEQNVGGANVYVGASLKLPDTDRYRRTDSSDFYVATAVRIDIDTDYDATRARMASVCEDGLVVRTGMTPTRRSQHWARLVEPSTEFAEYAGAVAALVEHTGADPKVKDAARVMRLGGTVAYPKSTRKISAGYCTELTAVMIEPAAKPVALEWLQTLTPAGQQGGRFDAVSRPANGSEVVRDWTGRVVDGRETEWRKLLLKHLRIHQQDCGLDPEPEELFTAAFEVFSDPAQVDNTDGRWTSEAGQAELRKRARNTTRHLRLGLLARFGLASCEPGAPGRDEAEQARANREATRYAKGEPPIHQAEAPGVLRARFTPRRFDGVMPPPRPWAWGDLLMYGATTAVAAPPGVGKTTFSFQIAIAFALNLQFGPWGPRPGGGGKVWLYNGEEPMEELKRRFLAACYEMGVSPGQAADRVFFNSGLDEPLLLVRVDQSTGEARRTPNVAAIKEIIQQHEVRLFIADPLIEFHNVPENATELFKEVGSAFRHVASECQCATLLFHHTPKAATSDSSAGDMNALRGGGPLIGTARFVATMFSMSKKDAEDLDVPPGERVRYVRFDDAKSNMNPLEAEPVWFQKLGVSIDNADAIRPADVVGVLRHAHLASTKIDTEALIAGRMDAQKQTMDKIIKEIIRVCDLNGHVSPETSAPLNTVCAGVDVIKAGVATTKIKSLVTGHLGSGAEMDGRRVVVTATPRGEQVVRRIHVEHVSGGGQ